MSRLFLAAALAVLVAGASGAADPAFDKALRDSLAGVHNSGADLYNQGKDYAGAFRLYEGALRTSRPLLAHRPATQAAIDDGLAAAARESDAAKKAFLLHEAIEKVRSDLKEPVKSAVVPEPKKTVVPEPKKTTTPEPKKTTVPEVKKGAAGGPEVKGKVTYKGQPVADATLTFTTLDRMVGVPAVTAKTGADATYKANLVAGRYAVTVTATANGKAVLPARYAAADTSGLTFVAPAGASTFDIDLQ
ncbi:MAG: carboxypeptidase-like regulatory domain-containing protein [Gemmataceae bacterium]